MTDTPSTIPNDPRYSFGRFFLFITLYLFILIAMAAYPIWKMSDPVIVEVIAVNVGLFYFLTVLGYALMRKSIQQPGFVFLKAFLLGLGLKMLISLGYLLLLIGSFKEHTLQFAVAFLGAYLVFTGFEVYYILHNLRQNSERK